MARSSAAAQQRSAETRTTGSRAGLASSFSLSQVQARIGVLNPGEQAANASAALGRGVYALMTPS